jgi:hypothetical protein
VCGCECGCCGGEEGAVRRPDTGGMGRRCSGQLQHQLHRVGIQRQRVRALVSRRSRNRAEQPESGTMKANPGNYMHARFPFRSQMLHDTNAPRSGRLHLDETGQQVRLSPTSAREREGGPGGRDSTNRSNTHAARSFQARKWADAGHTARRACLLCSAMPHATSPIVLRTALERFAACRSEQDKARAASITSISSTDRKKKPFNSRGPRTATYHASSRSCPQLHPNETP